MAISMAAITRPAMKYPRTSAAATTTMASSAAATVATIAPNRPSTYRRAMGDPAAGSVRRVRASSKRAISLYIIRVWLRSTDKRRGSMHMRWVIN